MLKKWKIYADALFSAGLTKLIARGDCMSKWNEQAAPNNNIPPRTIKPSEVLDPLGEHGFSEELSDGGERNEFIQNQKKMQK